MSRLTNSHSSRQSGLDVEKIRQDFPILKQIIQGHPLVYFDNAATTQKPRSVIEAVQKYYETANANVHRGVHTLSERASELYENARVAAARFLNAAQPEEIVFVRNATEGINLVAAAWARKFLKAGDGILLTEMEHHANLVPWQVLAKEKQLKLLFIPIDSDGRLQLDKLDKLLSQGVKLLALTHASNVLGTVNPVADIVRTAKEHGVVTVIDGAQAAPHLKVDVQKIGCDFYVCTGHKMLGPTGSGFVYGLMKRWQEADPYQTGGSMINEVTYESSTWNEPPWKFEAGTPDVAAAAGLTPALSYLSSVGLDNIIKHEAALADYGLKRLSEIEGIELYGPKTSRDRVGIISFNMKGVHSHDVATVCDSFGVAVRSGHHCAQPLIRKFGVAATARASFYLYNTLEEVDRLIEALEEARQILA